MKKGSWLLIAIPVIWLRESILQENYNNAVTNSYQILFILFTGKKSIHKMKTWLSQKYYIEQNRKWRHGSPKIFIWTVAYKKFLASAKTNFVSENAYFVLTLWDALAQKYKLEKLLKLLSFKVTCQKSVDVDILAGINSTSIYKLENYL